MTLVRAEAPGLPLFVLGHSLGGLIALEYAMHHADGLRGVIASAPPLGRLGVPAPLLYLGRIVSRVWPSFALETGLDLTGLARDPAIAAELLADPLFHRKGSARLSTEVAAAVARLQEGAARFPLPLLLLHGWRIGWSCRTEPASSPRERAGGMCGSSSTPGRTTRCSRTRGGNGCWRMSRSGRAQGSALIDAIVSKPSERVGSDPLRSAG